MRNATIFVLRPSALRHESLRESHQTGRWIALSATTAGQSVPLRIRSPRRSSRDFDLHSTEIYEKIQSVKRVSSLISLLILTFFFVPSPGGAVSSGLDSSQTARHVFRLPFKDGGFYYRVSVPLEGREVVFKKEPDFSSRKIIRGALPAAREKKDFLCFAWDVSEKKLYLDLNRNLALTDDPSGIFLGQGKKGQQTFWNVRFKSANPQNPVLYDVSVFFSHYRGAALRCLAIVRSGWQGDVELYGRKWQLAVTDNLDGVIGTEDILTIRPFEEGQEDPVSFSIYDRLYQPQKIFFGGHEYDLSFEFEPADGGSSLVAIFTELRSPLGRLKLEGKSFKRIILTEGKEKGSATAIIDSPGSTVLIPARTYSKQRIFLDGKEIYAFLYADSQTEISVTQDKVTPLNLGPPLKHTVDISRRGSELLLDYQIIGLSGEKYVHLGRSSASRPEFTIYRGKNKITSGSFRYG